MNTVAVKL